MRLFENGKEILVRDLGEVPMIDELVQTITGTFDLMDESTRTDERVFFNTFRLVGANRFAKTPQKYASGERKEELNRIAQPAADWLQTVFPECTPVLVQVATLPENAELLWHVDCYLYQSVSHKIHIPILSNPTAAYEALDMNDGDRGHSFNFKVGRAYDINNIMMHRAVNYGTPRAHLIIDMMETKKLELFQRAKVDFFFTHHPEHKRMEYLAAQRMIAKTNGN